MKAATFLCLFVATAASFLTRHHSFSESSTEAGLQAEGAWFANEVRVTASLLQAMAVATGGNVTSNMTNVTNPTPVQKAPDAEKAVAAEGAVKLDPETEKLLSGVSTMSGAQLPVMYAMLSGMYDHFKERIGEANKHEAKSKKLYEQRKADYEAKLKAMKDKAAEEKRPLQPGEEPPYASLQKTEERIFNYWTRQRELQHRQYHTMLKIAHGGMTRMKDAMKMYETAMAGGKPKQQDLQKLQEMAPEVVFAQVKVHLARFCQDSLHMLQDLQ
jgi:hypothetical protein